MVRVGGGWVALDEFLVKNDPCRGNFFIFMIYIYIYLYKTNYYYNLINF